MSFIEQLGIQAAGQAVSGGMGLLLGSINDRRQMRQQERLQQIQIKGQKELTDYNSARQLQMWKDTNYKAQKEQLMEAGLNPALLYGMSGGGGATASVTPGAVTGGNAPAGGREVQDMMGMGLQMQLLKAQKEVLISQAEKNKAEAEKTKGVDTKQTIAQTTLLDQEYDNKREQFQIMRLEQTMKNIENYEKQESQQDRLDYIEYQTKIASRQAITAANEAKLSTASLDNQIEIIRQQAIGAGIANELQRSNIEVNKEQIKQWIQTNMREWDKMDQENRKIAIQKMLADYNTDVVNDATKNISRLIDNIFFITKHK